MITVRELKDALDQFDEEFDDYPVVILGEESDETTAIQLVEVEAVADPQAPKSKLSPNPDADFNCFVICP